MLRKVYRKKTSSCLSQQSSSGVFEIGKESEPQAIPSKISDCEQMIKEIFCNSTDLVTEVFDTVKEKAMIVYIDGLVDKDLIDRDIIAPLKKDGFSGDVQYALHASSKTNRDLFSAVMEVVQGNVALFYEKSPESVIIDFKHFEKRSIEKPDSEQVTRGPKESFTENLRTNTALLRRKIHNPNLVFENMVLGRQTNTNISIVYIKGIVNRDVLKELKDRMSKIDVDAVLESGYIEQFIEPHPLRPISGMGLTQKPDTLAARILEGRVGVMCDGTPHVLTIPELFVETLHSSEDYYERTLLTNILRGLRLLGLLISVILPGLAVAVFTFNQAMIPVPFLTNLITSTQETPFPTAAEAFFLIVMFELLKEAGTRLPQSIGSSITIVGSLIIGDAAVSAGIVGAPMVIIIALTAVSSFTVPNLTGFITIYRFVFLFFGAMIGMYGVISAFLIMLIHIISTEAFGIPILSSFSKQERKDGFFRYPLPTMKYRPISIAKDNIKRMD